MIRILKETDFGLLKTLNETLIASIDIMLNEDVPRLVRMLPKEESKRLDTIVEMTVEVTRTVEVPRRLINQETLTLISEPPTPASERRFVATTNVNEIEKNSLIDTPSANLSIQAS